MKAARANALFQKTIADSIVTSEGTFDVSMEGGLLRLTDPRDAEFKRMGIDDATVILIPVPLIVDEPHLRVPCGCLIKHPGLGGRVANCPCGKVWRIWQKAGETLTRQQGDWKKNDPGTDSAAGDERPDSGPVPAPAVQGESSTEASSAGGSSDYGSPTLSNNGG